MRSSLSKVRYLLFGLLMSSLTACGTSGTQATGLLSSSQTTGKVAVSLVTPKDTAKSVASQAQVTTTHITVTGPSIPTATMDFANNVGGTLEVYPGVGLTVTVRAYASGVFTYEGITRDVTVVAGPTPTSVTINLAPPVIKAAEVACLQCHDNTRDVNGENLVSNYKQSAHYFNNISTANSKNGAKTAGCAGCHGTQHNELNPAASGRCAECHTSINPNHTASYLNAGKTNCDSCHVTHNIQGGGGCLGCHAISQNANLSTASVALVSDNNNGVRAVTGEFSKNSHHVTGKTLTNADCAVCHLEGTIGGAVDPAVHMSDNKIHLRNGNTGLAANMTAASVNPNNNKSEYVWDPANPNHTAMDQFCMSCHNAQGAPDAANIVVGNTARNPFNDGITNGYDQMSRTYVVAVYEQFDTGNTSHHAVRGKKYSTRTRPTSGTAKTKFTQYSGAVVGPIKYNASGVPTQVNEIFGNYTAAYGASGYGPTSPGVRKTIYEAGLFTTGFLTLDGTAVGDDSTLHCGDCHTVGQWKPGSTVAVQADGTIAATTAVIGAHGSANEYLLRNSVGTDALHVANSGSGTGTVFVNGLATDIPSTAMNGTLNCYLCHKQVGYNGNIAAYQVANPVTGALSVTRHVGVGGGDCIASSRDSSGKVGYANRVGAIASSPSGNKSTVFGIVCTNCHAGGNQIYGGIHGNASSYGDTKNIGYKTYSSNGKDAQTNVRAGLSGVLSGTGASENRNAQLTVVTRAPYRFAGGVSLKYNGGGTASKWEMRSMTGAHREGCYNLSTTTTGANTWSGADGSTLNTSANYATGTLNALPLIANAVTDDLSTGQNNGTTSGWGSCGHHTGSGGGGATGPTRTVQRPLSY